MGDGELRLLTDMRDDLSTIKLLVQIVFVVWLVGIVLAALAAILVA